MIEFLRSIIWPNVITLGLVVVALVLAVLLFPVLPTILLGLALINHVFFGGRR